MNDKAESRIRTLENTVRNIRGDTNLLATLWCHSYEHAINLHNAMIHSATQESPDYEWYGTRGSVYDFRVWEYHIETIHGAHLTI